MASPAEEIPGAEERKSREVAPAQEASPAEVIDPKIDRIVDQKVRYAMRMVSFSGPMPPPEHLAQYDKIVPGCARMIMEEFQANSRHSRTLELNGMSGMIRRDTRAQWMAFVLVLVGFFLTWELAASGHEKSAFAVATMLLGGIVTAFLTGHAPWAKSEKSDADADDEEDAKESD